MTLLFMCAGLGHHGGFENEVEATVRTALAAGHTVRIYTPYKICGDATIREHLRDVVPFDSTQEHWRKTWIGRLALSASVVKLLARERRMPTPAEDVHLARRVMRKSMTERKWRREVDRVLAGCQLVHMFGKPKLLLAQAARRARQLGVKTIYEEVNQLTPEYVARHDHRDFGRFADAYDVMIARCVQHMADMRTRFGYTGQVRIIEQWAYDREEELLGIEPSSRRPDELVVGALGRLAPEKRMDTVLRAVAALREQALPVRLKIAGTGHVEVDLRRLAMALKLDGGVEFLGYAGANKVDFYRSVDVFVIASRQEGGPVTGVEAMAAGLPIITTPVGAMKERLGEDGLYFEEGDVQGLVSALTCLARDPGLRQRLARGARRRYLVRNHSDRCRQEKRNLWSELMPAAASARH